MSTEDHVTGEDDFVESSESIPEFVKPDLAPEGGHYVVRPITTGDGAISEKEFRIAFPTHDNETLNELFSKYKNIYDEYERLTTEGGKAFEDFSESDAYLWFMSVLMMIDTNVGDGVGQKALISRASIDENPAWRNVITGEAEDMAISFPKSKTTGSDTGRLNALKAKTGLGQIINVPLWHSGIWLRMKSPTLNELTIMMTMIGRTKVDHGYELKGLTFANDSYRIRSIILNLAIQKTISTNVKLTGDMDLKDVINILDVPAIVWGLACATYPQGFDYVQPCMVNPEQCMEMTRGKIKLDRLLWVDDSSLTTAQKKHMSTMFSKEYTVKEIRDYQTQMMRGSKERFTFASPESEEDDIAITLHVPRVSENEEEGSQWVQDMTSEIKGLFTNTSDTDARNMFISTLSQLSNARQYADWVESVSLKNEDNEWEVIASTRNSINETLSDIFSQEGYSDKFYEYIREFMDKSIVAQIAIPASPCRGCGQLPEDVDDRFQNLIPINPIATFFTLARQKLAPMMSN